MKIPEIHTLIVWSKAIGYDDEVKNSLSQNFKILLGIDITWDKNLFLQNYKIFYAHSQKHKTETAYENILINKINHCGDETFRLYVYEDLNPNYEFRTTSSGNKEVNTNIFDLKSALRAHLGGGHKIHASDNVFESNKDLVLLLGKNIPDFLAELKSHSGSMVTSIKRNCIGVDGYNNIEEFFYVLNNSIAYCVLRNFECLPHEYTLEGHGDIDLLVDDLNYIKYLTLAKPVYPHLSYRVHYTIKIDNKEIPFDFRYVGDDYYDVNWQKNILDTSVWFNEIIKVPNDVNYFYTLLYHAYVQKKSVKPDYHVRLKDLGNKINVSYDAQKPVEEARKMLNDFLKYNSYSHTIPQDKTVYFNQFFLNSDNSREKKFGKLISKSQARLEKEILFTEVYDGGTSIVKFGSKRVIENELNMLKKLVAVDFVPNILDFSLEQNHFYIRISKFEGEPLNIAHTKKWFWTSRNIISFIEQIIQINEVLISHKILHRDIRPENVLVAFNANKEIQIKLIDFGWAIIFEDIETSLNPLGLGVRYKFKEGKYSDIYSFSKIFEEYFTGFSFKNDMCKRWSVHPDFYLDSEKINGIIPELKEYSISFSAVDKLKLFFYSKGSVYRFVKRYYFYKQKLKKRINKYLKK